MLDPITDHQAESLDEVHQLLNIDGLEDEPTHENGEPVGLSVVTPAWIAQAKLQNERPLMAQHIGQLYKANTDPAVLNEAVAQAWEARINLKQDQRLIKAGLNRSDLWELTDEESDHNHHWGAHNAPPQPMHGSALLPALLVNPAMLRQALSLNTPH
jgi:hypothetical protein